MSEHRSVASQVVRVTFFEDRAEVVRRARVKVPAGLSFVAITGVTAMVDDPSLVAGVVDADEKARVIAARVLRQVRQVPALSDGELLAIEADLGAARRRRAQATCALGRANGEEACAAVILSGFCQTVQRVPRGAHDRDKIKAWRGAYQSADQALTGALDRVAIYKRELEEARGDEARAQLRLDQGRLLHPRYETAVEVQIEAQNEHEVTIELTYRTPCVLWRPEHVARLGTGPGGPSQEMTIRTWATVWQRTGEDWRDVPCRFSTARPAQSASPPLLSDDLLQTRKKTEAERRTVVVEAREQVIAAAGLSRGTRSVDEMPGVEDGGEPLWFEAVRPATLPSDGRPVRVEIAEVTLPCAVDVVAFPERSAAVHIRATATLSGPAPLLAGPVRVARGSEIVGRSRTGFVARGEPFELGFGVDDGIRVRRRVEEKRETTPVIGTQKLSRTVKLYLSNLSGATKRLTVTERVPVSEIDEVKIVVTSQGARLDEKDGLARFDVELGPRATRELTLSYRIEAGAKVQLPF